MALTATAISQLRIKVENVLGMNNPVRIIESPDKTNMRISVINMNKIKEDEVFTTLLEIVTLHRTSFKLF